MRAVARRAPGIVILGTVLAGFAGAAPVADLMPRSPAPVAVPLPNDLIKATIHRLDNGLTVYLSENHEVPRVAAWIVVRAGGKHDPEDSTGMAHYLEHMLFKGSESLGTIDYAEEKPHLDRILDLYEKLFREKDPQERRRIYGEIDRENVEASGYAVPNELSKAYGQLGFESINAFTGNERTVFTCDFPSNRAPVWARLETDRFAHPVFRLFQTELEVVYEEKNMSIDNAASVINEALGRKLYKYHPYGQRTILGSIEHLRNPSLKKMYDYYDAHYVPNNMAIVLAGDFRRDEMLALVRKNFGGWEARPLPEEKEWPLPAPDGVERVEVKYESEEQVIIAWQLVDNQHPDADALLVMDFLMDNAAAGIINLTLNRAQKVKQAGSYNYFQNDAGSWHLWAIPKKDQTLEEAEALLLATVDRLKAGEFTDEDIEAIITNFEIGEKRKLESNGDRVANMAGSFSDYEEWSRTVEWLDRLRAVRKEDVTRVARKYLGGDRVVACRRNAKPDLPRIEKPEFTKVDIDAERKSGFFQEIVGTPAKPIKPKWLKEGRDYAVRRQEWGRLYAGGNPVNDLFLLGFQFKSGEMHEKEMGAAMGLMDLAGAGNRTADEFKKELYRLGTSLSFGSGERTSRVWLSGLDKNLERSLALMFELFRSPNIEEGTLEKMVQVQLGAHQDNKKNPRYVHYALSEYAERGAESRVLNELSDDELRSLKTERLTGLARDLWQFERDVLYVGNRPPKEIARLVDDGRRKHKEAPASREIRYLRPPRTRVLFAHRDMVQSHVGVFAADEVYDPGHAVDYVFYYNYMGGGMGGVIFQEIRESRALAYAAWGGYSSGARKGDENRVFGGLTTQADKTIEGTRILHELMQEPPFSEKRFRETAKKTEESYRTSPVQFRHVPGVVRAWDEKGIEGGDPGPARFRRTLKYGLADLQEFSRRFKGAAMTISILGHRDHVDLGKLKELGDFEEKRLEEIFPY